MTTITHPYTGGRPLVPAVIGISQPLIYSLANAGRRIPKPINCQLLIDSGADSTYIDRLILDQLRLNPTNSVPVQTGIPGSQPINFYQYEIKLRLQTTVLGQHDFIVETMSILCGDFTPQGIDGLIGLDLLSQCIAELDGSGQVFKMVF